MTRLLRRLDPSEADRYVRDAVDPSALDSVRSIVEDVHARGEPALREHAERFGDIGPGHKLYFTPDDLAEAANRLPGPDLERLTRVNDRIAAFARAQLRSVGEVVVGVAGGQASQRVAPVERAGCYAPGGRYPLPSSVLMTATTARVAGATEVWVASPRPDLVTLAAAHVAGADGLVGAGGAQAIAALAFGAGECPPADVIVGPGNRFVTAAKYIVSRWVRIDMLAGPSELTVIADETASPEVVAADLLAQAEHDEDAVPILVTTSEEFAVSVDGEIVRQLALLPTAETARRALENGGVFVVADVAEAAEICNRLAPEHLEVQIEDPDAVLPLLRHYGALFVGSLSGEVLGDYGIGPNHVLPTGGTARHTGGLSVLNFLRIRTELRLSNPLQARQALQDAAWLGEVEGLAAHARSASIRLK